MHLIILEYKIWFRLKDNHWRYLMKKTITIHKGFIVSTFFTLFIFVLFLLYMNSRNGSATDIDNFTKATTTSNTKIETTSNADTDTVEQTSVNINELPFAERKKLANLKANHPFFIRVNKPNNYAVVYAMDKDNHYTIPYKAFVCSVGKFDENTPTGVFKISDRYVWRNMVDGSYAQYAMRIHGHIMLHSVPYTSMSKDSLEYWEYNKLGKAASLGCIRFTVADIKWIYDNCPEGTGVIIEDKKDQKCPLPIKKPKRIRAKSKNRGWDPTDPDKNNPWKKKSKRAKGLKKKNNIGNTNVNNKSK